MVDGDLHTVAPRDRFPLNCQRTDTSDSGWRSGQFLPRMRLGFGVVKFDYILYNEGRSVVFNVDPDLKATTGDGRAINELSRFVKRPLSEDIWQVHLVKHLETPAEKYIATAARSNGFSAETKPQ